MVPDLPSQALDALDTGMPAVWLCVTRTRGSVPRETGAAMLVTPAETLGTIGGGHLEYKAIEFARQRLAERQSAATRRHFPLGPALGQCCGGAVELTFVPVRAADRAHWLRLAQTAERGGHFHWSLPLDGGNVAALDLDFTPWHVWVFGAGHVGRAIVHLLATLPCRVTWVDSREEWLLADRCAGTFLQTVRSGRTGDELANVARIASDDPAGECAHIPAGADVLVLTHSHALDFDIVLPLVRRDDLGLVGVIGSGTKAATFRKRLAQRGVAADAIARMICPIGRDATADDGPLRKHPGAIAVSVASALIAQQRLLAKSPVQSGLTIENGE